MNRILLILSVLISLRLSAQTSEKYNSEYENFYRAEELFEKEQFGAARREFRVFLDGFERPEDPMYIKALYYEALSAIELYNNDAVSLLKSFNKNYPESIYRNNINFRLGKFYYYKKKWVDALAWFEMLNVQDVQKEDRAEYFFKVGYANFKETNFDAARNAFVEIKDDTSQYAAPAMYYYSHIAYQKEKYAVALEGFLKLESHEKFGGFVPYYIAQIYYLQGKYVEVTKYASLVAGTKGKIDENEMNLLIGDAFYRIGKFDEAVPYLEKHNKSSKTTREEDYRLGYAQYKSGYFSDAIPMFNKVKKIEDSLGQIAYYHIAECMLKLDNKLSARSAFEGAAFIEKDPVIQEDALYNYAVLCYQLDINPYNEAVEAFELYLTSYPNAERREDIYQYLVNVYLSTNNYSKALASLDKLPSKNVRLKQAYQLITFNQGVERYQKNDFKNSIKSFERVETYPIDPSISGMAVYWIADSYYRLKNYDKAIELYKRFGLLPITTAPGLKQEAMYSIGYSYLNKADAYHKAGKKLQRIAMLQRSNEAFRSFVTSSPEGKQKQADAYMRIGDSYFVLKENLQAIKFYKKVVDLRSGFEDQALFYIAKTYGYMQDKSVEKIVSLLDIINNYPESVYLLPSVKAVADTYFSNGNYEKALQYYNKIIFDYPESGLYLDARINVADLYFKKDEFAQAEQEYLDIIGAYGQTNNDVCTRIAGGLKELYLAINAPNKIEALAQEYPCFEFSADEKENLYYIPAIEAYHDSILSDEQRYRNSIPKLESYIKKFPSGRYRAEVQDYLGNCYFQLDDMENAIVIYREALNENNNTIYTEQQAVRVSKYLYNEGQFEAAILYYQRLEQSAKNPERSFNAKLGLMRCHYQIENWQNAIVYGEKVISNSQVNGDFQLEAHYAVALSNYSLTQFEAAKPSLNWLVKTTTTYMGAEARYCLADIAFQEDKLDDAHDEISGLLKMKPKYNYWVAKGLILRSRVYMNENNLFQAESDLKSIQQHYPISDDGIIDQANQYWDELMQLKNVSKEIEEAEEKTIEIDEE